MGSKKTTKEKETLDRVSEEEIEKQLRAIPPESLGSQWCSSYEGGVKAALEWVLGYGEAPIELKVEESEDED